MGEANSAAVFRLLVYLVRLLVRVLRVILCMREELLVEDLALRQQIASLKKERPRPSFMAKVVALPRVGGLHRRYEWREAA